MSKEVDGGGGLVEEEGGVDGGDASAMLGTSYANGMRGYKFSIQLCEHSSRNGPVDCACRHKNLRLDAIRGGASLVREEILAVERPPQAFIRIGLRTIVATCENVYNAPKNLVNWWSLSIE